LQSTGTYLKSNVQVVSVSATPGTPTGVLDLSLKIDGTFDSVARTLGAIEYGPYDITITSLTFDTNPSSVTATTEPQWSAAATYTVGTINTPTDGNSTTTSATSSTSVPADTQSSTPIVPPVATTTGAEATVSPIRAS
jgi:hypothetical protein